MKNIILTLIVFLPVVVVLALTVKGLPGNPTEKALPSPVWQGSVFELSPERGRFALTLNWYENRSPFFSLDLARFVAPDIGYHAGHYVSLFAPAVSFLALPGYILGKSYGLSQVGSFATVAVVAAINFLLIKAISQKLGAHPAAALLAGLVFLFATPAFAYSTVLYQHHVSTLLILLSIYILLSTSSLWSLFLVWFLCAASIPTDYPNLVLMFPIGLFAIGRFIKLSRSGYRFSLFVNFAGFITFISTILPMLFFFWFNYISYGSAFQLSGTVRSVDVIDPAGRPVNLTADQDPANTARPPKTATGFFLSRNLVNGLYIHILSPDRGVVYFTPVILLGLVGISVLASRHPAANQMLVGILLLNLILYSLWGDPWGGWAFGSRYLIPGYAIAAIFLSLALTRYIKFIPFAAAFIILAVYSVSVNTLGALTSNTNPPQIQILELERLSGQVQKYTFARNWDQLSANRSKSFYYQAVASHYLTALNYFYLIGGVISLGVLLLALYLYLSRAHV